MPRRTAAPHPLLELTEAKFQAQVVAIATTCGWKSYHTHDSRKSVAGFPDLVLSCPRQRRVIFAELKKADGKPSDEQKKWLASLAESGAETALWRPADIEEIKAVLSGRRITQWAGE